VTEPGRRSIGFFKKQRRGEQCECKEGFSVLAWRFFPIDPETENSKYARAMKTLACLAGMCACLVTGAMAEDLPLKMEAIPSQEPGKRSLKNQVSYEEILATYTVKISNTSFMKDAPPLVAKYRIFVKRDNGLKNPREEKPVRIPGEAVVPAVKSGEKYTFQTESVKLVKAALDPKFYYTNHAQQSTADKLVGIWLRLFQGDHMVGEYALPASLAKSGGF
jgi:hypothetical protein